MKAKVASKKKPLRKRSSVKSGVTRVDLGPTITQRASTKTNTATEGYLCPPHYQQIGKKKYVNKMVKFMYPSHRLVYRAAGVTSYVDNEQAVTMFRTNECIDLNDAFTSMQTFLYDQGGTSGNPIVEPSTTVSADPANSRIGGYLNKMYLESHYVKLRLSSNVEIGQKVEVVPIVVKQNLSLRQFNTVYDASNVDPLAYWKQLIPQQQISVVSGNGPTNAATVTVNRLGERPYSAPYKADFERFFKCLTPAKFVLQAGQQTTFGLMQHVYKELKMADLFDYSAIEGITMFYMVFTESTLVGNANQLGVQVNTGSSNCMYMLEQTRTVRLTSFNRSHTLSLNSNPVQIARNDQVFIDAKSGNAETGIDIAEL